VLEPLEPWEPRPVPRVRIPGMDGAVVSFDATANADAIARGIDAVGVKVAIATPERSQVLHRLPVEEGFPERLAGFLGLAASHLGETESVEAFVDSESGITLSVEDSTDCTVLLRITVTREDGLDEPGSALKQLIDTSRAALITAREEAFAFADRQWSEDLPFHPPMDGLPLDLLSSPSQKRLTGVYLSGSRMVGDDDMVLVSHYVRLTTGAQGDVETALIAAHLPFCEAAAHGVYEDREPWVLITQLLPAEADTGIAQPWDPTTIARDDLHAALANAATDRILGEGVATRDLLLSRLTSEDVPFSLLEDWETGELALASLATVASIPVKELAVGMLTGCAYPDVEHDCSRDVFDCAFSRWQEQALGRW